MKHDPFYQQIIDGLCKPLDPDTFELCASDLLRTEWPTLVPIRGGDDSGMDGAIADAQGDPFPLVCTTAEDVIGNLTRSLNSYLADGGSRRRVIVATSQSLSQPRRQNLQRRATEKDFELVQIYERATFAILLYQSPEWCRELLGLTGNPSALSVIPRTQRPLVEMPLVGRDEDLEWLLQASQDAIIFGVPGCGETALLQMIAREYEGVFVVDEDRGAIASALRAQQPKRLIVDDAHLNPDLLVSLRQLRAELGADFQIIACCWPGERDAVLEALQIPRASARELKLLIRDEIVKVIQAAGVRGPQLLIREIVDQAEGRPGLAVTLSRLCLQGGVKEVALGHALGRSLRTTFELLAGVEATEILAILSLGGRSGMPVGTVANLLGLPLIQVRRQLAALAAGGVIDEVGPNNDLAVRPTVLQHALVRDVFFSGTVRLPVDQYLPQVPDPYQAISVIIGARARGGDVPDSLLEPLLERSGSTWLSTWLWREFAWLGPRESTYVLTRHPDLIVEVARPALHHIPERAIPLLLQATTSDQPPRHQYPEHPLRVIEDWVYEAVPGTGEALRRRRTLVRSIGRWLRTGGDSGVVASALKCAISPQFSTMSSDPGSGMTLTVTRGLLTPGEIEELASVWAEVAALIGETCISNLKEFLPAVEDLVYPGRRAPWGAPDEAHEAAIKLARAIVTDLAPMVSGQQGLAQRLQPLADHLDLQLEQRVDADFAALYPAHRPRCIEAQEQQATVVRALAGSWADRDPDEIAHRLLSIERQASAAGLRSARWTPFLCHELAQRVACTRRWAGAMLRAGLPDEAVSPFIGRCAQEQEEGWEDLVKSCLAQPSLRACVVRAVLHLSDPPRDLLESILPLIPEMSEIVEYQCGRPTR